MSCLANSCLALVYGKNEQPMLGQFMKRLYLSIIVLSCPLLCLAAALPIDSPDTKERKEGWEYNRDIRPILAENCFACHGPDSAARKANLRLDQREVALKKKAFVPGKPDESEMITRIESQDD